ncbi:ABC transporter ATP-binding protein [Candidatus Bathyarchaeota archaeon]|nr:MAG: ABC transporter ATP-binding protein [Candidatus Bathyarchaeota archaeon]
MITLEQVWFKYPSGSLALQEVDFSVESGSFIAIMGENGAGKTTLAKHLNGLLKPSSGRVLVDGEDTRKKSVAQLARKVGLVFQNPDHLLFSESVRQEVAFALKNFGYPADVIETQVKRTLESLDLSEYADTSPFLLSGGERKRVALAAVLAWEPDYLILDEPTIGQDYQQKERLRNFILQLYSQGKAVVMITHDVEFVAECNPQVVLMSKGKVVGSGSADRVLSSDQLVEKASLVKPQMAKLFARLKPQGFPGDVVDVHRAKMLLEAKLVEVKGSVPQSP